MKYNNINKPIELLDFMKNIKYGYRGNDNKLYTDEASDAFKNNWYSKCIVQDYEEILKTKIGTCWDQVELERNWFEKNNYEFETYFLCYDIQENHSTHTFLTYKENNKYYWFENAFFKYRGIHEYESIDELLNDVINKSIDFNKKIFK